MCHRFQFFTHQRVCILYFLKKSQIRCTLLCIQDWNIAGAENPYILMQVFGRGHQVTRNGVTVYVTRCQTTEVALRTHTNCTNEILAELNRTHVFVDPISFMIKAALVRCK